MRKILAMMRKEFLQIRGDRRMVGMLFIAPLFQVFILGFAVNMDVVNVPVAVSVSVPGEKSRMLLQALEATGNFRIAGTFVDPDSGEAFLAKGRASLLLQFPADFERTVGLTPTPVAIIVDGADASTAVRAMGYLVSFFRRQEVAFRAKGVPPPAIEARPVVWYNPELRSRYFLLPGVLAMVLMVLTTMMTAMSIVKERENGTFEQLSVTPLNRLQLTLGKILPFALIGYIEVISVVVLIRLVFGLHMAGSAVLLIGLCSLFLLTTLGIGMLVSTFARTQQQSMLITAFFVMMPMMNLSGFAFPIENFPPFFQVVSHFIPMRYFLAIVRGIYLKGNTIIEIWPQAAALGGSGLLILTLAMVRFQKKL